MSGTTCEPAGILNPFNSSSLKEEEQKNNRN